MAATAQLTLDFQPGLTARFRSLREATAHAVYASKKGLSAVAADLDMSPTDLTKRLNPDGAEPRPLRTDDLEGILASTGDMTPIYWLIEKYLQSDESRRAGVVANAERLLRELAVVLPALRSAEP